MEMPGYNKICGSVRMSKDRRVCYPNMLASLLPHRITLLNEGSYKSPDSTTLCN